MSDFAGTVLSVGLGGKLSSGLFSMSRIHSTVPLVLSTEYLEKLCCGATARDKVKHAPCFSMPLAFS